MDVAFELVHDPSDFDVEFLFARETALLRCHPRFAELADSIGLARYWATYVRRGDNVTVILKDGRELALTVSAYIII